jgi:hypothetical protein
MDGGGSAPVSSLDLELLAFLRILNPVENSFRKLLLPAAYTFGLVVQKPFGLGAQASELVGFAKHPASVTFLLIGLVRSHVRGFLLTAARYS